ncbi:hypothetical protein XU18_2823 [Perkinsela sp. CCAP 1560/4]|nr:hypothetical protein XU18_2823 [Perkinsela sp. CCAP 1560/4]|eukprot:KNH06318.1 hypothetical protein XU18_2823 [Perkinsela sp. CCAP 1560/4]
MLRSCFIQRFSRRLGVTTQKLGNLTEIGAVQKQIEDKSRKGIIRSTLTLGQGEGMKTIRVSELQASGASGTSTTHFLTNDGLHVRWGGEQELWATENISQSPELSHLQVVVDEKSQQEKMQKSADSPDYMTHFLSANVNTQTKKLLEKNPKFAPVPSTHIPYLRNDSHIAKLPLSLHIIINEEMEGISKDVSALEAKYRSEALVLKGTVIADVKRDSMRCRLMLQRLARYDELEVERSISRLSLPHAEETESLLESCRLCSKFMRTESRREALRARLERCRSVIDLLRGEYHTEKSHWLEWIIIWLILLEVFFGIRNIVNDVMSSKK